MRAHLFGALATVLLACASGAADAATPATVQHLGDLHEIGAHRLDGAVPLRSLVHGPGRYALGMTTGLATEVLVLDGKRYSGGFDAAHCDVLHEPQDVPVTFALPARR